jgi:DNA-binding NarL/FixJ family response regulator
MLMKHARPLTARQQEIVAAVLEGATNRQIAERLHVTEQTVKNQLWKVYGKVGVANRLQLAVWAMREVHQPGPAEIINAARSEPASPTQQQ